MEITETPASSQPTAEPSAPQAAPSPEPTPQPGNVPDQAAIPAAYVPNTKFKFLDSEKEFDQFVTPILNKETEPKIRELYQKAFGLDHIKPKYQKVRDDFNDLRGKYDTREKALNKLSSYLNKNDFDSFFETLKIPEQAVMKYVLDKLNQKELPPEQQQIWQQRREAERNAETLHEENERMRGELEQTRTRTRESELNTVLSQPDVQTLVKEYDIRLGAGSFRNEVIQRGVAHFVSTGQDLSADEAVMKTLMALGAQAQQQATVNAPTGMIQVPKQPVIPQVAGKSTSPSRKVSKSIDDLRNRAKEFDSPRA